MLSSDGVISLSGWLVWLKKVYRGAQGFELGTLNSLLLAMTMKRQSTKWKSLVLGYIADIVTMTLSDRQHGEVVRLDDLMQNHPMSNADHAIQDLHDSLLSYYKVALKRFCLRPHASS